MVSVHGIILFLVSDSGGGFHYGHTKNKLLVAAHTYTWINGAANTNYKKITEWMTIIVYIGMKWSLNPIRTPYKCSNRHETVIALPSQLVGILIYFRRHSFWRLVLLCAPSIHLIHLAKPTQQIWMQQTRLSCSSSSSSREHRAMFNRIN